jgi:4'-phosphopantetheinyl transferase EntD
MQAEIVHSTLENISFTLSLWTPTETDDELMKLWQSVGSTQPAPEFKASHRKREWIATRLLLNQQGINQVDFLANGKPVWPGGGLSISHCYGSVAVVTADVMVGLDIQEPTEQIFTIRSKFCSLKEWRWLEKHSESLRALTIVWSVKEAIFKYWGEQVDFAKHIEVSPFDCDDSILEARYCGTHGERTFRLWHATRGKLEIVVAL